MPLLPLLLPPAGNGGCRGAGCCQRGGGQGAHAGKKPPLLLLPPPLLRLLIVPLVDSWCCWLAAGASTQLLVGCWRFQSAAGADADSVYMAAGMGLHYPWRLYVQRADWAPHASPLPSLQAAVAAVVAEKDAELQAVQDALRQQLEVQLQLQRAEADLEISDLEVGARVGVGVH